MNCYFLSFGTKKELERIKKKFQRAKIKYTANKEHLFIVYYYYNPISDFINTEIVLHEKHPFNQPPERDQRERSLFIEEIVHPEETILEFNHYDLKKNSVEQLKKEVTRKKSLLPVQNREQHKNILFSINLIYAILGNGLIYAIDNKNLFYYLNWKYGISQESFNERAAAFDSINYAEAITVTLTSLTSSKGIRDYLSISYSLKEPKYSNYLDILTTQNSLTISIEAA